MNRAREERDDREEKEEEEEGTAFMHEDEMVICYLKGTEM